METGNDGRFYDSHYDFNGDGHLDVSEQLLYDDDVYGDGSGGSSGRRSVRRNTNPLAGLLLLLFLGLFVFEIFIAALCAPIGVILIYFTIRLKEKLIG